MRIVMLAGIFAASTFTANAQEGPRKLRGRARICTRSVLALPCSQYRASRAANDRHRPGFPDHCQRTQNDGDRASRLLADAAPEDAEPDPDARSISRRDRLSAQPARSPTTGNKALNILQYRASTRLAAPECLSHPVPTLAGFGLAERLYVADQVIDLCPRQR
jgi:hypothetical protein